MTAGTAGETGTGSMVNIDGERLLSDLRHLATFGKFETGVDRPAFGDADMAAREWLCGRMAEIGLEAAIDNVGNVYGRAKDAATAVLIGSHSDTVPKGGWLDGALGVGYGLEIARAVAAAGLAGTAAVDVISFQEEEGSFLPMMGSRAFCGAVSEADIDGATNAEGRSLRSAIADSGLMGRPPARVELDRHTAYLEAHIEQGPRLEASGTRIGVVTALVGIRRFRIVFTGQADHAGTTPMDMRRDAGAALIRLGPKILDLFEAERGPDTVWNLGKGIFEPGAFNVVPARAELLLEFRDTAVEVLDRMENGLRALVAGAGATTGVSVVLHDAGGVAPARMDDRLRAAITAAAGRIGAPAMDMPSGAGHDAMVLSGHVPAAMLFIPSIGGRSHDIAEDSTDADIVLGCQVMAAAVAALLADGGGG